MVCVFLRREDGRTLALDGADGELPVEHLLGLIEVVQTRLRAPLYAATRLAAALRNCDMRGLTCWCCLCRPEADAGSVARETVGVPGRGARSAPGTQPLWCQGWVDSVRASKAPRGHAGERAAHQDASKQQDALVRCPAHYRHVVQRYRSAVLSAREVMRGAPARVSSGPH